MDTSKIGPIAVAVAATIIGLGLAYFLPKGAAQPIDQVADQVIAYETGEKVDIYAMEQRLTGSGK